MNKKATAKEQRMEALRNNGVNVDNFFNLSLSVPVGHEVKILIDNREMIIPVTNDSIAQSIIENGYVKNNKLFRRWIFSQTMYMLNYVSPTDPNRKGWEACMKDCYGYNYQFEMLLEEIRVLSILQKEDKQQFVERTHFFNGDVVVATLNDYLKRLKKYVNKQMKEKPHTYKGQAYVVLAKYRNVLVSELNEKVYEVIQCYINGVIEAVKTENYKYIYNKLKLFMNHVYNKLPYETTKCQEWKDAFKGAGGYYSLQNACRWHNVILKGCYGQYDSEDKLRELLDKEYKNEVWRFNQLLVDTIEYNNFDLGQSIAAGNKAPSANSQRAMEYHK